MTYSLLGQDLHETADRAKQYFSGTYGATSFLCEASLASAKDLRLSPTWQAKLNGGYILCVNVQPSPFSQTLYEFVMKCVQRGLPAKLWVAVPQNAAKDTFNQDLRQAREVGIGVVQFDESGGVHEYHRAVPLSLFALKKTDLTLVPKPRREEIKNAEGTFLDGAPDQGCQSICQAMEDLTRIFAETTYTAGMWKMPSGATIIPSKFFAKDSWANVLEEMEKLIDAKAVAAKTPTFSRHAIVRARAHTDWRNEVSHKPKTLSDLQKRDAKLRTMFENTRDILLEWYEIAKPLKLLK